MTLETVVEMIRALHIAAGVTALAVLFVPMFAAKGGRLHRRAGWVYVYAMGTVAVTAVVVSGYRILTAPGMRVFSIFLLYIAVLSATNTSAGIRVLRAKTRTGPHRHAWDLALPAVLLASGLFVLGYGFWVRQPLLMGFAPVGILTGGAQLAYWLRAPQERMHWWYTHMGQMIGSGIGTVTAFVVVNAPRLGLPQTSLLVWLAPGVVGTAVIVVWTRYYRRRFAGRSAAPAVTLAA